MNIRFIGVFFLASFGNSFATGCGTVAHMHKDVNSQLAKMDEKLDALEKTNQAQNTLLKEQNRLLAERNFLKTVKICHMTPTSKEQSQDCERIAHEFRESLKKVRLPE